MIKALFSSVALVALSVSAFASDLPARANAPAVPAAPSTMDAFGTLSAGYNWGGLSGNGESRSLNGLDLAARATFAAPLFGNFGFQADGQFERLAYATSDIHLKKTTGELAGHAFWRDSSIGLVGVIAQGSSTETNLGVFSERRYFLGGEGQYFINNVTLYGQAAYENLNFGFPNLGSNGVSGNGVIIAGQVRYFARQNLMLALKGSFESVQASLADSSIKHSGWLIGAKTEYRLDNSPVSLTADLDYRATKFNTASLKDHETRLMLGAKYNFNAMTLFQRDRSGASLDPIRSLKAAVPAAFVN